MMTTEQNSRPLNPNNMEPEAKTIVGGTSVYDSARLFKGSTEIGIEHDGAIYRLKITRQGKLILNK
jgi:hemin uptake protein HemP